MNAETPDPDFTKLQQMLKLKRYEQPHPRYFNDFSGQVLSRIRAGRTGGRFEAAHYQVSRTSWLRQLWQQIEAQPALAGAIATVACGLMVAGGFLLGGDTPRNMDFMAVGGTAESHNLTPSPALNNNFAAAGVAPHLASSINISPFPAGPNLFQNLPTLQTVPAASDAPLLPK